MPISQRTASPSRPARRGFRNVGAYVSMFVLTACVCGITLAPSRSLRAWRASGRAQASLFAMAIDYDALLDLTVGELRESLAVPREGLATVRGLHSKAPRRREKPGSSDPRKSPSFRASV